MKLFLTGLWVTGVALVLFDFGVDTAAMAANSKLVFKLLVVISLTVNGILIHLIAIPLMSEEKMLSLGNARKLTAMSSISTSHWLLAAFIGCFQPFTSVSIFSVLVIYLIILSSCAIAVCMLSRSTQIRLNSKKAANQLIELGFKKPDNDTISLLFLSSGKKPNLIPG